MELQSPRIRTYRWIVFLLAAGYWLYFTATSSYSSPLGPFRFLTIWALSCSVLTAWQLLSISRGRAAARWEGFVSMTAVVNAMVVFLYWRLFLDDPASVTRTGELGDWWMEGYLHALGPLLQWIDAVFLHRAFRAHRAAIGWTLLIVVAYLTWTELVVAPLNTTPAGSVTSGLPYPFLNNMDLGERAGFYVANLGVALLFLSIFTGVGFAVRALGRRRTGASAI